MKNEKLYICDEQILPGEKLTLALPLPELFSCAPLYMPIKVIHGKKSGPCLLVTAAMHGNELNGTEIINRLLEVKSLNKLCGTLLAVPVVNVYGLINRSRYLPGGIELDQCFPGSETGSHASRMARSFIDNVFSLADVCIDLQTGFLNYTNLPQVYVTANDKASRQLAQIFNAPVITDVDVEPGSLRSIAKEENKSFICYEAGEAMRFDNHAIKTGVQGILNVMRNLGMLPRKTIKKGKELRNFFAEKNIWVRASTSGISHSNHQLGQRIQKGERLCVIKDPFGASEQAVISSPDDAVIVGKNNLPLVHEGEGIFQLAVFPKMNQAAQHLEEWQETSEELFQQAEPGSRES